MALTWDQRASVPDTAEFANYWDYGCMSVVDGKLYVIPYQGPNGGLAMYDPSTDVWTSLRPPASPIMTFSGQCVMANVENVLQIINLNTYEGEKRAITYDVASDTFGDEEFLTGIDSEDFWTPGGRQDVVLVNGYLWFAQEHTSDTNVFLKVTPNSFATTMEGADEHQTSYRAYVADDAYIYGVEGYQGNWSVIQPGSQDDTGVLQTYDVANDTWTYSLNTDPNFRNDHAAVIVGDTIYVLGGGSDDNNFAGGYCVPWVSTYSISGDTWTVDTDLPVPTSGNMAAVCDGYIYVFSGYGNSSGGPGDPEDPELRLFRASLAPSYVESTIQIVDEKSPSTARFLPV